MSNHADPVFGPLREEDHGYWTRTIAHGEREIRADLNLDGDVDADLVRRFSNKLDDLAGLERLARQALLADADKKRSAVKMFRERHEPLIAATESQSEPQAKDATGEPSVEQFLQQCELKRVSLYPECPGHCLILDFGLRSPVTDYLLVVSFDGDDRVVGVDMQS